MIVNDIVANLQFPLIKAYQVTEKQSLNVAMSSPGHEIQSFLTSYLVPYFSEVWKCGVV